MKRVREAEPPRGLMRWLYRLPIALYDLGLGRLLGRRFLLLHHTGRHSGLARRAVLEVVRHDPERDVWLVASGFGERSQWLKNLRARPDAEIEAGGRRRAVRARVLERPAAEDEMLDYARRHPGSVRSVARLVGLELDGSEADLRAFANEIRLVAFEPRP